MKKIVFYIPLIVGVLFYGFIGLTGMPIHIGYVVLSLLCLAIGGILLSCKKAWGGIFPLGVSAMVIYNGFHNWKLGRAEITIGIILFVFYLVVSIVVFVKNREQHIA